MERLLQNKNAIITGANQGLGLEIARKYLEAGANLCICARNEKLLRQAERELNSLLRPGQTILALPADVSSDADVTAVAAAAREHLGGIDILVNNAGVYGPKGAIEEVDWR
jgi:NAD(P)-dependent dehydrogenase (short-subunit alcohol dehydrogenase family)